MKKRLAVLLGGLLLAVGMPSIALGGNAFTMHPAGSGQKTYASWKANVGEPDTAGVQTGTGQAIFMQKNTDQQTQAVVVIRGLTGEPASSLQSVSWDRKSSNNCGASPHWQISVTGPSGTSTVPFGACGSQQHHPELAQVQFEWTKDICDPTGAPPCIPTFEAGATINSLAIVFEPTSPDFVLLDDITVNGDGVMHTWLSAADNGSSTALKVGPSVAYADVVSDVLGDLLNLFPGVAATDWTLYPGVDLTPLPTAPAPPSLP